MESGREIRRGWWRSPGILFAVCLAALPPWPVVAGAADVPPSIATPVRLSDVPEADGRFMGVRLLGALRLAVAERDGLYLTELSGLAWDRDEALLYAVSDRGAVFHLQPVLRAGRLADVRMLAAYPLRGGDGAPLVGAWSDAEGLVLEHEADGERGNTTLLISFEGRPRVERYTTDGSPLERLRLPPALSGVDSYRDPNSALESLVRHPSLGLMTAPERPLAGMGARTVPLCTLTGRCRDYPLADAPGSALTALEPHPDGGLLALERAFVSMFRPLVISLRHVRLPEGGGPVGVETLATFDTSRGWQVDNFEGLAFHEGRRYFMVSDDNGSPLQHTLLVYFELLPQDPR